MAKYQVITTAGSSHEPARQSYIDSISSYLPSTATLAEFLPEGLKQYVGQDDQLDHDGKDVVLCCSIEGYQTSLGFRLPAGENIADWMIDAVCGIAPRYNRDGTEDTAFNAPADLFENWTAKYKSTQVRWDGVAAAQGGGGRRGSAPNLPGVAAAGRRRPEIRDPRLIRSRRRHVALKKNF